MKSLVGAIVNFPTVSAGIILIYFLPVNTAFALNQTEIGTIAEKITVRIESQNPGSGVLIQRQGNTYTVLTAAHVVETKDEYEVITNDNRKYTLSSQVTLIPGVDLALVEFSSSKSYQVATIGDSSRLKSGASIYVSGFPVPTNAITEPIWNFSPGHITANASTPLADGYSLVYTNRTLPGMSGGGVLNDQGQLIGIHGRADAEQHVKRTETIYVKTGFNLGIPINTLISSLPKTRLSLNTPSKEAPKFPKKTTADDWFLKSVEKYQKKDYQGAISNLNQALEIKPDYSDAYNNRGIIREITGDKDGAISDLTTALKFRPKNFISYYNRANIRQQLGDKQGALSDYNKAISLKPDYSDAYHNRGLIYKKLGNYQEALTDFDKAIQLKPDTIAYSNRGSVRFELGDNKGSIADFTKALELDPNNAGAYLGRGNTLDKMNDRIGAIENYSKAIQINPTDHKAFYNRGTAYIQIRNLDKAISDYDKAIQLKPDLASAFYNRGTIFRAKGKKNKAISDYQTAARLFKQQKNKVNYELTLKQLKTIRP